jgi:hypothetical protein
MEYSSDRDALLDYYKHLLVNNEISVCKKRKLSDSDSNGFNDTSNILTTSSIVYNTNDTSNILTTSSISGQDITFSNLRLPPFLKMTATIIFLWQWQRRHNENYHWTSWIVVFLLQVNCCFSVTSELLLIFEKQQ